MLSIEPLVHRMNCCAGGFSSSKRSRKQGNKDLGPASVSKDLAQADGRPSQSHRDGLCLFLHFLGAPALRELGDWPLAGGLRRVNPLPAQAVGLVWARFEGWAVLDGLLFGAGSRDGLFWTGSTGFQEPSPPRVVLCRFQCLAAAEPLQWPSAGGAFPGDKQPQCARFSHRTTSVNVSNVLRPLILTGSPVPCQRHCVYSQGTARVSLQAPPPVLQASSTMWTPGASSRIRVRPLLDSRSGDNLLTSSSAMDTAVRILFLPAVPSPGTCPFPPISCWHECVTVPGVQQAWDSCVSGPGRSSLLAGVCCTSWFPAAVRVVPHHVSCG